MNKETIKKELDKLGVKYHHALGEEKLQALLDGATHEDNTKPEDTVLATQEEINKTIDELVTGTGGDYDIAVIVSDSGMEMRRYTLAVHGENFEDLANQFKEGHKNVFVKLEKSQEGKKCKHCG